MPAGQEELLGNLGGIVLALVTVVPLITLGFIITDPDSMAQRSLALQSTYLASTLEAQDSIALTPDRTPPDLQTQEQALSLEQEGLTVRYPLISSSPISFTTQQNRLLISGTQENE